MRSRQGVRAAVWALALAACGPGPAHEYPADAQTAFHVQCPADNPECACTWEEITRALSYEEYEAALARFEREGLMDPRITRARGRCRERRAE